MRKILLVEDDLSLGQTILDLLEINLFKVKWCKTGYEALHFLERSTPDAIVCDLMMPSMNGEELFFETRKISRLDKIPFIVITADITFDMKIRQLEHGVNDYLTKPFKIQELILKLKNIIKFASKLTVINNQKIETTVPKLKKKNFLEILNSIIEKNMHLPLDVDVLAAKLYVSKSTLYKKIKKLTNCNTTQYVREYKIQYAIQLIEEGETNVQTLADNTGFGSLSYFSVCFKRYTKVSPKKYIQTFLAN